jgi:hypothetical protein
MKTIKLFIQVEGDERTELVELALGALVKDVLIAAQGRGLLVPGADALFFDETNEEPLNGESSLEAAGIKDRSRFHIHRCRKIEVKVHFKAKSAERAFPPSATVARVHEWAAHRFLPNDVDRTEHELQICETESRPKPDTQIGALAKHGNCSVCFDLVPTERVEG